MATHFAHELYFTWHKNSFDYHAVTTGNKKDPRLPDVSTLLELMDKKKTANFSRSMARALLVSATLERPIMTSPDTPADRVTMLRDAFVKTFKAPEVVEEDRKTKLEIEVLTGTEVESQIRDVMGQPKDVIERVKKLSE